MLITERGFVIDNGTCCSPVIDKGNRPVPRGVKLEGKRWGR